MHVRYLTPAGAEVGDADDLVVWRGRSDGFVWLDLDACDEMAATLLRDEFGFHPQAIQACRQRRPAPLDETPGMVVTAVTSVRSNIVTVDRVA